MTCQTPQLTYNAAQPLGTFRHFDFGEGLDGHQPTKVTGSRGSVVHAVGIPKNLSIRLTLSNLLRAAMQVTNYWYGFLDVFAVHFQHDTQDPMSTGVLRAQIQDET